VLAAIAVTSGGGGGNNGGGGGGDGRPTLRSFDADLKQSVT